MQAQTRRADLDIGKVGGRLFGEAFDPRVVQAFLADLPRFNALREQVDGAGWGFEALSAQGPSLAEFRQTAGALV